MKAQEISEVILCEKMQKKWQRKKRSYCVIVSRFAAICGELRQVAASCGKLRQVAA